MPVYLLRHGRTHANAQGLFQGRADNPLDDFGRRQAASAAAWIGPVDRVVTSPLLRTRQTAEAFGIDPTIDERFIELDYGDWDGRPVSEIAAAEWDLWRLDMTFTPPGGESLLDVTARVDAALSEWASADRVQHETTVVVSHVSPIKAATAWALQVPPTAVWHMRLGQATVTHIEVAPRPTLVTYNVTPPLLDD